MANSTDSTPPEVAVETKAFRAQTKVTNAPSSTSGSTSDDQVSHRAVMSVHNLRSVTKCFVEVIKPNTAENDKKKDKSMITLTDMFNESKVQ